MRGWRWTRLLTWVGGAALCGAAGLCSAQSIYTCIDSKGRRLTHDRPIAECNDREQQELYSNGTVKRTIGPALTEREADLLELRQRKEAEDRARITEARRRDRALITRYQNVAAHDAERAEALRQVDDVMAFGFKRLAELDQQRASLDSEFEFYKRDPSTVPPQLTQKAADHAAEVAAQRRFIADQLQEKKRVNARFDTELSRLRHLWAQQRNATQ